MANTLLTVKQFKRRVKNTVRLARASTDFYYDSVVPAQTARLYGNPGWVNLWVEYGVGRMH